MKKLAVIGASYLQMPLVKRAKDMEIEVHCFAWEDGAVCKDVADYFYPISILDKEEILKICRMVGIDGITTIASDVAVLTVNYVAAQMGLIGNPDDYSEVTTNKFMMRECFLKNEIPSPRFTMAKKGMRYSAEGLKFPMIVKPTDRSGSRGVAKVETLSALNEAVLRAQEESFCGNAIIEEYIDGREISVECISYKGIHYILQITDKVTTGAPFFVELEHHQPSTLSDEIKNKVKTIVLNALDALHIQYGASHSELKITDAGDVMVIEIGARMGGDFIGSDLVMLSTGYDFLKGVIEIAMGNFHEPEITEGSNSGVCFLCKETEHIRSLINNWKNYPEIVKAEITNPTLRSVKCSNDRSGYYIYRK